jgi:hypothetical protein
LVVCYGNLEIVVSKCSYDYKGSDKWIHLIRNPLFISDVTQIHVTILNNPRVGIKFIFMTELRDNNGLHSTTWEPVIPLVQ